MPTELQRLREFFIFCDGLEAHPFFVKHKGGGEFRLECDFPETGEDSAILNFDEIHLESFLARLRQFFFSNELFFIKNLRRATNKMFGVDKEFEAFYNKLWTAIHRKFPQSNMHVLKKDGSDIIANFTFPELIEARLYTGAIHSTKRIDSTAQKAILGVADAHIAVSKHLTLALASASMSAARNIFCFRNQIHRLARKNNKEALFKELEELEEFDKRVKDAGR